MNEKFITTIFNRTDLSKADFDLLLKLILEEKSLEALEKLTDNIYENAYSTSAFDSNMFSNLEDS